MATILLRDGDRVGVNNVHGTLRVMGPVAFIDSMTPTKKSVEFKLLPEDVVEVEGCGKFRGYHLMRTTGGAA